DLEAMIILVRPGLFETQRIHKEPLGLSNFTNGEHRPVESASGHVGRDFADGPAVALIGIVLDDLELQSRRMAQSQELLPEALLYAAVRDFVMIQMPLPELNGSLGNRVRSRLNLSRSRSPRDALVGEGCIHRPRFAIGVRVIQMIVGVSSVEQNGLF